MLKCWILLCLKYSFLAQKKMNLEQPAALTCLLSYIQYLPFWSGGVCVLSQVKIYFTPSMFWVNLRLYRSWLKTKLVTRFQDFLHIAAETVRWLCLWEESSCMRYFCLIKWSFMQISINQSWLRNTAHQLLLWTRRHMEQITLKSQRLSSTLVLSSVFLICACI